MNFQRAQHQQIQFLINPVASGSRSNWLGYFMAAMTLGGFAHADEVRLNYWWVYADPKPADNTRVIRVIGAKGESYEEVYGESSSHDSVLLEYKRQRQAALREEALCIANALIAQGKKPLYAYREAWVEVYRRHWLNTDQQEGATLLDKLLERIAHYDAGDAPFTEDEIRVAMEALMEDDDRLETEEGRKLLEQLANRLRGIGRGLGLFARTENDELMARFASAMRHGKAGAGAYRDALFKTHRGSVINHPLIGYSAPWGAGLGGGVRYSQAAKKVSKTAGTGNTQGSALSSGTPSTSLESFLATSPSPDTLVQEEETKKQEEERKQQSEDEGGPQPVYMGPLPSGNSSPMMFSMVRAAAGPGADKEVTAITDAKLAELVSKAKHSVAAGTSSSIHQDQKPNSYSSARWNGSSWTGTKVNKPKDVKSVVLNNGSHLYLGNSDKVSVVVNKVDNAYLHGELDNQKQNQPLPGYGLFTYDKLQGKGNLTLMGDTADRTTIYAFKTAPGADQGFSGTISMAGSRDGSRVQFNVTGSHWKYTLLDLTPGEGAGYNASGEAAGTILNVTGDTQLLGLKGGDALSTTVTSNSGDASYTLTLGDTDADQTYTYGGTFNGNYYVSGTASYASEAPLNLTKVYGNRQEMVADATGNSAFNVVTVTGGTLAFLAPKQEAEPSNVGSLQAAIVEASNGGILQVAKQLIVTETYAETEELLVTGDGSRMEVGGTVSVADDAGVRDNGFLSAASLLVSDKLTIDDAEVEVKGRTEAQSVSLYNGASLTTEDLLDATNHKLIVEVGDKKVAGSYATSQLTVTGNFEADVLRLRSDGRLVTGTSSNTIAEAYLHGGSEWEMAGASNTMSGTMYIENVQGSINLSSTEGAAVLTLPGTISFANAGWTDRNAAAFTLDGVTLDFSRGVTITNLGFAFNEESTENKTFVLATTTGEADAFTSTTSSVMVQSGNTTYHAYLVLDGNNVLVTLDHTLGKDPFVVEEGKAVYIEMYQNAASPALPYMAYTNASYSDGWSGTSVEKEHLMQFSNVVLNSGSALYLGEDSGDAAHRHFGGKVQVNATAGAAQLHGTVDSWSNWLLDGNLSGEGELQLVAHHGIGERGSSTVTVGDASSDTQVVTTTTHQYGVASTFTFTSPSSPTNWLEGTVKLAANAGTDDSAGAGIVQLNIGNVNIAGQGDTRWENVVVDLTAEAFADGESVQTNAGTATELVLGVVGDATIAGLRGDEKASVVSDVADSSPRTSPTLTVGTDGQDYTFKGTVGSGNFYTGGQATRVETTTDTYTHEGTDSTKVSSTTTAVDTNMVHMGEGRLSLVKVGSNTQEFTGSVYLDEVEVRSGTLSFGGKTSMNELTVQSGAVIQTAAGLTVDSATLYGGASWLLGADTDFSSTPLTLMDMTGQSIYIGATDAPVTWTAMEQISFAGNSSYSATTPWFVLGDGVTLNMGSSLTLSGVAGLKTGDTIALFGGVTSSPGFDGTNILITDASGYSYEASYSYSNDTVYLTIGQNMDAGIMVRDYYIWSGEKAGYTDGRNEHHLGLTMGNVWRADGSAEQTGWHEQRDKSVSPGVYKNGVSVLFADVDVHGADENNREVYIYGKVAPGRILVTANDNDGSMGTGDAELKYGYAFTGHVDSANAGITDYKDEKGNIITRTSIEKTGDAVLILNTANDFSGGIEVKDGALYLSRPYSSGTGAISLYVDSTWTDYWDKSGSNSGFEPVNRVGSELMVNYEHNHDEVSAYRNPVVQNTIILKTGSGENGSGGHATISYAHAAYESKNANDDFSNVPRHWRNLSMTGGLYGEGDLELRGYTSCWDGGHDQCYISAFTINNSQFDASLVDASELTAFTGTVKLTNAVNTSFLSNDNTGARTAGGVQLSLSDSTFAKGHIDLTREQVVKSEDEVRQSYTNILVVNGDVSVGTLEGDFLDKAWIYSRGDGKEDFSRDFTDISQEDERMRLRVVTGSETILRLGLDNDSGDYVYSGAMGYAQSYTQAQQAHISFGDGMETLADVEKYNKDFDASGKFSNGTETLSLVKSGQTKQYIHSAVLNDVSLYQGTLGFNNLELKGNMNLVGGSLLRLGVTDIDKEAKDGTWDSIDGVTSSSVTVGDNKTLTVITPALQEGQSLRPAYVEGDIDMSGKSTLTFLVNTTPDSLPEDSLTYKNTANITPLLDVDGTLKLSSTQDITMAFDNTNFSLGQKYYIARADAITIDGNDETFFGTRTVTLGYGYFGTIYTVGNNGCSIDGNVDDLTTEGMSDYLVMTVTGDPRRTWSGMVSQEPHNNIWTNGSDAYATDYRWKENRQFVNGHVVLFGNLNVPTKWTVNPPYLESDDTVNVDKDNVQPGTLVENCGDKLLYVDGFALDSYELDGRGYQAVNVAGEVAPFMVMINANYEEFEFQNGKWVLNESQKKDDTNYYFYTTAGNEGGIRDATREELIASGFDENWKTMVHKTGTGTTIMALDNSYTGGTILQGGTMVMQHVNALGGVYKDGALTGQDCTITLMNGASLQGDFDDEDFPGNYHEEGNLALGKAMATTTINNKIVVNVYANPDDASYSTEVDGRLINSGNKKLIIKELAGESDTVLLLSGVSLTREEAAKRAIERYADVDETGKPITDASGNYYSNSGEILNLDRYNYGVFKVLDPGAFYGTVTMCGHVWGSTEHGGGMVQLDIMSTSKSSDGADWTNATMDLSVKDGTLRTVLALDVMSNGEVCELNSINGTIETKGGSSSVLNMSKHNAATLQLTGTRSGKYEGVLGYGDFQVAVNYGGYTENQQGTTQHHYGAIGEGSLNVLKKGDSTTQEVRRAWLNRLDVQGGMFVVTEALVAHEIASGDGKRVLVGAADPNRAHALAVGAGGILAMNTTFAEEGVKQDAWEELKPGVDGVAFVRLENGATLSAREDWFTIKPIDFASGASVTVNTRNYAIDPQLKAEYESGNDVFGKYEHSHIIQLLGNMSGMDVKLTFNNALIDPVTAATSTETSPYMGYAAINDFNLFRGTENELNVESRTVLQIMQDNKGVEGDVDVHVEGLHATLQILDKVVTYDESGKAVLSDSMVQYIEHLSLGANQDVPAVDDDPTTGMNDPLHRPNNGQLLLGGAEVKTLSPTGTEHITTPDMADMQVLISSRHNTTELEGEVNHLHVDLRGASARLGGAAGHRAEMVNTHVDMARSDINHTLYHTNLKNSLVHLQEDCSVDVTTDVHIDFLSEIQGVRVEYDTTAVNPVTGPEAATGNNITSTVAEVNTSSQTLVELTFDEDNRVSYTVGPNDTRILVLQADQFKGVDVKGNGLTIQLFEDWNDWADPTTSYVAVQMGGGFGQFLYEEQNGSNFAVLIDNQFVLLDRDGNQITGMWVTSDTVSQTAGITVSSNMLYFKIDPDEARGELIPEPSTATLSLLALAALCARRRRRD